MPRTPWFVARESGTSFIPNTWQGYLAMILYVVLLSASSLTIFKSWALFLALVVGLSIILAIVVAVTREKP